MTIVSDVILITPLLVVNTQRMGMAPQVCRLKSAAEGKPRGPLFTATGRAY